MLDLKWGVGGELGFGMMFDVGRWFPDLFSIFVDTDILVASNSLRVEFVFGSPPLFKTFKIENWRWWLCSSSCCTLFQNREDRMIWI